MGYDRQTKAMLAALCTLASVAMLIVGMIYATAFTISFVGSLIAFRLLVWFWLWYFDRKDNPKEAEHVRRNPYY